MVGCERYVFLLGLVFNIILHRWLRKHLTMLFIEFSSVGNAELSLQFFRMLSFLRLKGHIKLVFSNWNIFSVWHHMFNIIRSLIRQIVSQTARQHAHTSKILVYLYLWKYCRFIKLHLLLLTDRHHRRFKVSNLIFQLNVSVLETTANHINAADGSP